MIDLFRSDCLKGCVAFVAGGTSGLNLAIAQRYATLGASLGVISRDRERVRAAVERLRGFEGPVFGVAADVRDADAVAAALKKCRTELGPFDVVVSGAAGNFLVPAAKLSTGGFETVVGIDLLGTFNVFRAALDHLAPAGSSLIAVSAPQGARAEPGQVHACAAKAGVNMLVRCLAVEWGPHNIRVNAISPGPVTDTEGMKRLAALPEVERSLKRRIPMGRFADAQEIADVAVFLASRASRFVTGAIIDCDGGYGAGDASQVHAWARLPLRRDEGMTA